MITCANRLRTGLYGPVGGVRSALPQIAVTIAPGSMAATRMPNGATSNDNDSVAASSAHFDAQYGAMPGIAIRPA